MSMLGLLTARYLMLALFEPSDHVVDICIRRKDWIPIFDHLAPFNSETHSPNHFFSLPFKRRKLQRRLELELVV